MFGPYVNNGGDGDHTLGWSGLYNFLKAHILTSLNNAYFNADHDELIEIYIFQEKLRLCPHLLSSNNMEGKKKEFENDKWCPKRCQDP